MRIALIYDAVYPWMKGGGEKALWEIATGLTKRGHEIHLFSAQLWEGASEIEKEGVFLHGVPAKQPFYRPDGKRSFLQPLEFAWGLYRKLWQTKDRKFDVIYCTVFPYYSVLSVAIFRYLSSQKIPWVIAWLEVWGIKYWQTHLGYAKGLLGSVIEWLCAQCCDHHLVISEMQKRRLVTLLGVSEARIRMIPRGAREIHVAQVTKKPQHLIYAGRLVEYKNLITLIRALPLVRQALPHVRLTIIGSGPEESRLHSLATQLELHNAIDWVLPLASSEDVLKKIGEAEILLQPSTREGLGVVVLEAMLMGTLVIASGHPESAVSDIIRHKVNGLLVEQWKDPAVWAATILEALRTPERQTALQTTARCEAAKYLWQNGPLHKLEDFLQKLTDTTDK